MHSYVYTYTSYVATYVYEEYFVIYADTFILQNCTVTSPSIGTIRVSCDSSHQIVVTLTCTSCNNSMATISGSSPLIMRALDPGIMYSVMINVFDGYQVVLRERAVAKSITVMSTKSGKII